MNLYLTADKIGIPTGGGAVTFHESEALRTLGACEVYGRDELYAVVSTVPDPWKADSNACAKLDFLPTLCHAYAGTFTDTFHRLKDAGSKLSYTAAAHNINVSRREHEALGLPFDYPHLNHPELWKRYVGGYLAADLVICPSTYSKRIMEGYGCKNVTVIPHGCELPETIAPMPKRFTVGYLGAYGADKGVKYLLAAWKKLNYTDATLLLAGRDSTSDFVRKLIETYGGGNIRIMGWVKDVADFYGQISFLCQASASEGFGIEVLEAMSHGRMVICSDGAGAADLVNGMNGVRVKAGDVDGIAAVIESYRLHNYKVGGEWCLSTAAEHIWEKIRQRYVDAWKELL